MAGDAVFYICSSDSDEPQPNMSAFLNRRRYYSKRNSKQMTDFDKKDELSLSQQINDWNSLRNSIESIIQKLNPGNIRYMSTKLLEFNIIRGKGLLCRAIMKAQSNSLQFTHIYATLVSFINCDFPNIVELLLVRCICLFTNAYKCKEENKYVPAVIFIAHLVDNNVVKDWLVLDILKALIKTPNLNAIGMIYKIMKICGKKLSSNPQNKLDLKNMFDTLKNISEDEQIGKSVQCLAKVILLTKINNSEDEPDFYLVNPSKQFSHSLNLNDNYSPQYELDSFVCDLDYKSNEIIYKTYAKPIIKLKSKVYYFISYNDIDEMADDEDDSEAETNMLSVTDNMAIQKTISLLVNLKLPPSEIAHELMQFILISGQELELCIEYVECCFENSVVYNKIFADIIQSFCLINPSIVDSIELIFKGCTPVIHLGNPNKLQNLAKFFAHLLCSDSISWKVFSAVNLTEYEFTYSGRAYLKALFNELISLMGRDSLKKRILDPSLQSSFVGLFPLNNRDNYGLCVHFFSDIGLYDVVMEYKESLSQGVAV